ncbi:MAG TPA: sigma-70 family RNA polymerase sigma factor [Clostridia bacterium]|nr:sigma-70 family RNA polymerase sigma factor [Clostridia bacterium]
MYDEIEKMFDLYYYELYWYILKMSSDRDIVDDIIQNTFLEALKSIESFRMDSSLKTWLFSIAKYQLYRYFRANKRHIYIKQVSQGGLAVNKDFSDRVLAEQIIGEINGLNPPLDEIMRLRLIYGLPYRQIGKRVNRTESYCRVNFYRIKEKLRKEHDYE